MSVIVHRLPFGLAHFTHGCTAQLLTNGTLIVRLVETGGVMDRYPRGSWERVEVKDARGDIVCAWTPQDADRVGVAA